MAATATQEKSLPDAPQTAPSLGFVKFNLALQTLFQAGMFCALVAIAAKLYAKGGGNGGVQPAQVFINQVTATRTFGTVKTTVTRALPVSAVSSFTVTPAERSVQTVTALIR